MFDDDRVQGGAGGQGSEDAKETAHWEALKGDEHKLGQQPERPSETTDWEKGKKRPSKDRDH